MGLVDKTANIIIQCGWNHDMQDCENGGWFTHHQLYNLFDYADDPLVTAGSAQHSSNWDYNPDY